MIIKQNNYKIKENYQYKSNKQKEYKMKKNKNKSIKCIKKVGNKQRK